GRPQWPADELLPLEAPARARRPSLPIRVRLRGDRRLPRREDGRRLLARGRDAREPARAGRRLHLYVRHGRCARSGQGRDGREAARPLRGRRHRRAGLGRDRDPRHRRSRDRDLGSIRGRGDGLDALAGERMITYDARGLVEPDDTVPRVSEIDGDRAVFDATNLTTRKINLELRWLLYEEGVKDVTVLNPGAKHSLGVGILTRCRITFDGSLGYFGCGLIDGPAIQIKGRVGWSACENM